MTTPSTPQTAKPSSGMQAILAAAGSSASTVGALAAATSSKPKLSLGLTALAGILAFLGALSRAPNTVHAAQ